MIPIKTDSAWKGTSNCRTCGIRDMVLFADLKMETVSREISALVREGTLQPIDRIGRIYRIQNLEQLQAA